MMRAVTLEQSRALWLKAGSVPHVSRTLLTLFERYARYYFKRHFSGLYVAGPPENFRPEDGPYAFYLNHPSWWDPLVGLMLAQRFARTVTNFAPMDSRMLEKFGFFRRLGFFGIEKGTGRGAMQFRQSCRAILERRTTGIWLTPQNDFADARQRPPKFKEGLAMLPELCDGVCFVPLALEYSFGSERLPFVAARFGTPAHSWSYPYFNRTEWNEFLSDRLEQTQNGLAHDVMSRSIFNCPRIVSRRSGTGGVYGFWQKLRGTAC